MEILHYIVSADGIRCGDIVRNSDGVFDIRFCGHSIMGFGTEIEAFTWLSHRSFMVVRHGSGTDVESIARLGQAVNEINQERGHAS